MKSLNSKKGFTLIELLIVIAIIAVLAVAMLPTLLGAPAKGRDTARIASLQKIQKVLVSSNLDGNAYPATPAGGCINDTTFATYKTNFGGTVPVDPQNTNQVVTKSGTGCAGNFIYELKPNGGVGAYSFGLYAKMETQTAGNTSCAKIAADSSDMTTKPASASDSCYAILTQ